jgi:hypothetical protein
MEETRSEQLLPESKASFFEFVHAALLFDELIVDDSSGTLYPHGYLDVQDMAERCGLNVNVRMDVLVNAAHIGTVTHVVCQALRSRRVAEELSGIELPDPYSRLTFLESHQATEVARHYRLSEQQVSTAVFLMRGLCYSAFANGISRKSGPCTYLASPGRMRALAAVLSETAIGRLRAVNRAYAELSKLIPLPDRGYIFDELTDVPAHALSQMSLKYYDAKPEEVLAWAGDFQKSSELAELKADWLSEQRTNGSGVSLGLRSTQFVSGSTVGGDLVQNTYIMAMPAAGFRSRWSMSQSKQEPKQKISRVRAGSLDQETDSSMATQEAEDVDVEGRVRQKAISKQTGLRVFGGSATGTVGVLCLVIVLLGWLAYSAYTSATKPTSAPAKSVE